MDHRRRRIETKVAALAAKQHGVIGHRQLIEIGLRPAAIQRRVRGGRLHRVHLGVYAVGHPRLSTHGRWAAAVLAGGPGALLSHQSAAQLLGIARAGGSRPHVTAPGRTRAGQAGIVLHLPRRLNAEDCDTKEGIPVTSVTRTLLDLAASSSARHLARALEEGGTVRDL